MKKWQKILFFVLAIVILIPIIPYLYYVFCMSSFMVGSIAMNSVMTYLSPERPIPKIKYAEFPFELVYEIDEQTFVIEDIYVCEFEKLEWDLNTGYKRYWKNHIKSIGPGEDSVLLLQDKNIQLRYRIGFPENYMDDPSLDFVIPNDTELFCIDINKDMPEFNGDISTFNEWYKDVGEESERMSVKLDELIEKYKIKIISLELDKPIGNTYK